MRFRDFEKVAPVAVAVSGSHGSGSSGSGFENLVAAPTSGNGDIRLLSPANTLYCVGKVEIEKAGDKMSSEIGPGHGVDLEIGLPLPSNVQFSPCNAPGPQGRSHGNFLAHYFWSGHD